MRMEVEGTKKYKFLSENGDCEIALKFEIQYWIFPDSACYFFTCDAPFTGTPMPLMCFTLDAIDEYAIKAQIDNFIDDDIATYADRPDEELFKDALLLKQWLNNCVKLREEAQNE